MIVTQPIHCRPKWQWSVFLDRHWNSGN